MADEQIVSAVAVASGSPNRETAKRIEQAMADEVLKCNAEGISTSEENAAVIRERVLAARQREIDAITAEQTQARNL